LELEKMNVERIVVDESVNRNFKVLKRIKEAVGVPVEIIVNSILHTDCTWRMFHYNQIAGDSLEESSGCSNSYYPHKCLQRRYENKSNLLKLTWVRPEDLKYYLAVGINYFKLQGRPRVLKGDPVKALEAYFKEDYHGDLFKLLDLFAPGAKEYYSTFDPVKENVRAVIDSHTSHKKLIARNYHQDDEDFEF
jgi:hypothetical protein